jgi:serine/threonine-protein kinase RsbT
MTNDIAIPIQTDIDIVTARQRGRQLAAEIGFSSTEQVLIATAISEIARNLINYAIQGQVSFNKVQQLEKQGFRVIAKDQGPGIVDTNQALQDGYSTSNRLGLGLPGAKRLMDDFEIVSTTQGTTVTMTKWRQ